MRLLLYCVFRSAEDRKPEPLLGVGRQPVFTLSNSALSVAVSRVSLQNLTPNVSRVLSYASVIESFHRVSTVVPMRYGCQFEEEPHVLRFLAEGDQKYKALLSELDGCVEMGIRIFPKRTEARSEESGIVLSDCVPHALCSGNPGRLYLAARKAHYVRREGITDQMDIFVERCREALGGLSVKSRTERPSFRVPNSVFRFPLVSLYFLIPRQSVEPFRNAFRRISSREPARFLLSGPWPPYNFAEPAKPTIATPLAGQSSNE